MANWPIHRVPNPLDVTVFRPRDRSGARRMLGLPADARIILFEAVGGGADPRKGYYLLLPALRALEPTEDLVGVIFGQREPSVPPRLGLPLRWLGHIEDEHALAVLYSAADVMVVPSRQEALGRRRLKRRLAGRPGRVRYGRAPRRCRLS